MVKKRFGISIDSELLESVEKIAKVLNTTRSAVVEEAIRFYVADYCHLLSKHLCGGIILIEEVSEGLREVVERFRDVVLNHMHLHAGRNCVDLLLVYGDSTRIAELQSVLVRELRCATRFVPLASIHKAVDVDGRTRERS